MVCKCLHNCIYELLTNDELMMNSCLINDLLMVYKCFIMLEAWLGASYWPNVWLSKYPYELAKYSCFLWIIFDTNCRLHILHFSLIMAAVLLFILIERGGTRRGGCLTFRVVLYSGQYGSISGKLSGPWALDYPMVWPSKQYNWRASAKTLKPLSVPVWKCVHCRLDRFIVHRFILITN